MSSLNLSKSTMADSREERVKQLVRKGKVLRRELESFQEALNMHERERCIIAIKNYLEELEKEFVTFGKTQCELDDMNDSETMQEHIELKQKKSYNCKERALRIVHNANTQIGQKIKSNESNSQGRSGAQETLKTRGNKPARVLDKYLKGLFDIASLRRTSYANLQSYAIKIEINYNALQVLGPPSVDTILLHLLTSKLPPETRLKWKEMTKNTPSPTVAEFLKFISQRCDILASTGSARYKRGRIFVASHSQSSCPFCRGPHGIWGCNVFKAKPVRERFVAAKEVSACTNCLNRGHVVRRCTAGSCRICGRRHHTLLHRSEA